MRCQRFVIDVLDLIRTAMFYQFIYYFINDFTNQCYFIHQRFQYTIIFSLLPLKNAAWLTVKCYVCLPQILERQPYHSTHTPSHSCNLLVNFPWLMYLIHISFHKHWKIYKNNFQRICWNKAQDDQRLRPASCDLWVFFRDEYLSSYSHCKNHNRLC